MTDHSDGLGKTLTEPIEQYSQGPEWLVELLTAPPDWLIAVYILLFVLSVGVIVKRLQAREWTVTDEQQQDMLVICGVIVGVLSATMTMAYWSPTPYVVDVVVGFVAGYGVVLLAQTKVILGWARRVEPDLANRYNLAWLLIICTAVLVPLIISPHYRMAYVISRAILVIVGFAMVAHNQKHVSDTASAN